MSRPTALTRWVAVAALIAVLGLAALTVGVGRWFTGGAGPADAAAEPADALAMSLDRVLQRGASARDGVAIRPFLTPPGHADDAALAEAVCAALAERLARLPTLRVVPCRSTQAAVAAALDDERLTRLLAVRHVLAGSLESLPAERLRVRLALHKVGTAGTAWRIDEEIGSGELQTLPARVAALTRTALGQAASAAPEALIAPQRYAQYLRASQLARRMSLEDRRTALALLEDVLAAEPDHVPSLFLRQTLHGYLLGNLGAAKAHESVAELNAARAANVAQGLALARRLVAADPQDMRGQYLLLGHDFETRQWAQGFERLDGMLQRNARHPGLMRLAARVHLHAGYVARAAELALGAAQLNALDGEAMEILALVAGIQRQDAQLRERTALARQIGHEGMGRAEVFDAFRRADWAELERAHSAWVGWGGKWSADWVPAFVRGLRVPAEREGAMLLLDAHDSATRQHFVSYFIEYALLGDPQRSLRSVQHHARLPPATWMQHLWWPELEPLRQQPGFVQAVRDLGMTGLWERRGAPDFCRRVGDAQWVCR